MRCTLRSGVIGEIEMLTLLTLWRYSPLLHKHSAPPAAPRSSPRRKGSRRPAAPPARPCAEGMNRRTAARPDQQRRVMLEQVGNPGARSEDMRRLLSPETKPAVQIISLRPHVEDINHGCIIIHLPDQTKISIQPNSIEARMVLKFPGVWWARQVAQREDARLCLVAYVSRQLRNLVLDLSAEPDGIVHGWASNAVSNSASEV